MAFAYAIFLTNYLFIYLFNNCYEILMQKYLKELFVEPPLNGS